MPEPLFEIVPNFSEGTDDATIHAIGAALVSGGALLADVHRDPDHNRSVFTVIGTASQLRPGAEQAVATALEHIDLTAHAGVHPRVGACDVLPVVPLQGLHPRGGDMPAAIGLAHELAAAIGAVLGVPAILYGAATVAEPTLGGAGATMPTFAGSHRSGGQAALAARLAAGEVAPHAGPPMLHPTGGAVLVGARDVLVAFNIVLASGDLGVARDIAAQVRERGGGLPGVRALGLPLASRGLVQVSTNVERWSDCSPANVLHEVTKRAAAVGIDVLECELVGLAPRGAWQKLQRSAVPVRAATQPVLEEHASRWSA